MKALMSNTLREILSDPQKKEDLKKGISQLQNKTNQSNTVVSIGGQKYEIEFVSQDLKE